MRDQLVTWAVMAAAVLLWCGCEADDPEVTDDYQLKIVAARGVVVPADSLARPVTVRARPPGTTTPKKFVVDATPGHVIPVGPPKVLRPGTPQLLETGVRGALHKTTVPAIERPVTAGLPTKIMSGETYSPDPNPHNFSSFSKLRGLEQRATMAVTEDRLGRLWIATLNLGIVCYDGRSLNAFPAGEGLPDEVITKVYEDRAGNLWFGTWGGGITRYDGKRFTTLTTEDGLNGDYVLSLAGDAAGNVWIGTHEEGFAVYDGQCFTHFRTGGQSGLNNVMDIHEDRNGNVWLATTGGVLKYDGQALVSFTAEAGLAPGAVTCIAEDIRGQLWFGTSGGGLLRYDGGVFSQYTEAEGLVSNFILSLLADSRGNLWFGSQPGGVTRYDGDRFEHYAVLAGMTDHRVRDMYEDTDGSIWFATDDAGVAKYVDGGVAQFASRDDFNFVVHDFVQDADGRIWMSTRDDGIAVYDGERFTVMTDESPGYGMFATGILLDRRGDIWFGSWGGLNKYDGASFTRYTEADGLSVDRIYEIAEDRSGNLWIGTELGGVTKFDGEYFTHYSTEAGLSGSIVTDITQDRNGTLWFASLGSGATSYDGTVFTHFDEASGLGSNSILNISEDRAGNLWFATSGSGAVRYDGEFFTHLSAEEGLGDNLAASVVEDSRGNFWFTTREGIAKLTAEKLAEITEKNARGTLREREASTMIRNYEKKLFGIGSGIGDRLFEDRDGKLWFGARDRLSTFDPANLYENTGTPQLYLTDVAPFNESVNWEELLRSSDSTVTLNGGVKISHYDLSGTADWHNVPQDLSLAHTTDNLSFSYVGINLRTPQTVVYQYRLDGLEPGWSAPTDRTTVSYGNLPPGGYAFRVRAREGSGDWGEEVHYPFTIRPPWWATWWAYLLYAATVGGGLYALYAFRLGQRLRRAEAERLRELAAFKTRLYTNITHEFRTPLTLILGMAERVIEQPKEYLREGLEVIVGQGQTILSLVDQMLDLSKLQDQQLPLRWQRADVMPVLRNVTESFHAHAAAKGVRLHFAAGAPTVTMDYDEVRLQQVLSNLIANAIKFTPRGGHVRVSATPRNGRFVLGVTDTGTGIARADLPRVFDRFFQADNSLTRRGAGTGIGLALTRELVTLMGGDIGVSSQPGRGTEFEVSFPLVSVAGAVGPAEPAGRLPRSEVPKPSYRSARRTAAAPPRGERKRRPLILIAEDNADVRDYLSLCLRETYRLTTAENGRTCQELALRLIPDLIVLDVMMPLQDGYATCKALKSDERTSHIPIIMLTARADPDSKLAGLRRGADDYLTKPFRKEELLLRIRNLFVLRRRLQAHYRSVLAADEVTTADHRNGASAGRNGKRGPSGTNRSTPRPGSLDDAFVVRVKRVVETHLDDDQFTVAALCRTLALSHSQVHRKLTAVTGLSATLFIRYVRLLRAKELLRSSAYSVSAITAECGFSDPAYFSRVFRQEFGINPLGWREAHAVRE